MVYRRLSPGAQAKRFVGETAKIFRPVLSTFAVDRLVNIEGRARSAEKAKVFNGKAHRMDEMQGNDRDAHDRLSGMIGDHQRCLYLYIYSLVHRSEDAYDVLQETNLALWRDADRVEAVADFRSWAYRVAFNQVLAFRKRRVRDRLLFDDALLNQLEEDMQAQVDPLPNSQEALQLCARKLPNQSRHLLAMRYQSALSVKAIAEQLGLTVAGVSKSLYRIRLTLRKCVQDALGRDEGNREPLQ